MPTNDQVERLLHELMGAGSAGYPTKEQIMDKPHSHKPDVIRLCIQWKKEVWFPLRATEPTEQQKFEALKTLLQRIAAEHYNKPVEVDYQPEIGSCCYQPALNRITINKSLSILSSLHELAHHLFGNSETKACRWSVWLFKKSFPKAFRGLEWKGHMLVKPTCSVS